MEHQFAKRFEELKKLKNGWLDGGGIAFDKHSLDQFRSLLELYYPNDLPTPRIYPSPDGELILEWMIDRIDASLEANINLFVGFWHQIDLDSKEDDSFSISLEQREGWRKFIRRIYELCKINK